MKLRYFGLIILFIFCFGIMSASAQDQKDQLYFVYDHAVKPSKIAEHEAAIKELMALHQKDNFKYQVNTYRTNDIHYIYTVPLKDMSEFVIFDKDFSGKLATEPYRKIVEKINDSSKCLHTFFTTLRNDLSYLPENSRMKSDEVKYVFWNYFYVINGKQNELEGVWKEYIALYKEKGIKDGWNMLVRGVGSESPMHVGALWGKSEVDYFTQLYKTVEITGDKGDALWNKALSLCNKLEQRNAVLRPDLSYTPKSE